MKFYMICSGQDNAPENPSFTPIDFTVTYEEAKEKVEWLNEGVTTSYKRGYSKFNIEAIHIPIVKGVIKLLKSKIKGLHNAR